MNTLPMAKDANRLAGASEMLLFARCVSGPRGASALSIHLAGMAPTITIPTTRLVIIILILIICIK